MIFFSKLLGAPIIDLNQDQIGVLKDIIVKSKDGEYPKLSGIIFKFRGKMAVIPYQHIETLGYGEVTLKKSQCWDLDYDYDKNEFLLAKDVLDQQIFDVGGIRVVRANDLELAMIQEKFALVGIDVSNKALLRRLGFDKFPIVRNLKSNLIDWNNVSMVKDAIGSLKLKTSREKLEKLHPADIANMIENLNYQESSKLVQSLDEETAAEVLEEVAPEYKDTLLERISHKSLAEIVGEMPSDQAVDVMKDLSEYKRGQVLKRLDSRRAIQLHKLSKYHGNVAGGLMNSDFMAVAPTDTVAKAIGRIRKKSGYHGSIYHVFVVDDEKHLQGIVSVRTLLVASGRQKIADIMSKVVKTVRANTKAKEVARLMTKYNLLSVSVVGKNKILRGIVTVDDILRYLIPDA